MLARIRRRFADRHGDAGFTVLEALVSFVVFAIAAGSATLAIDKSMQVSNTTHSRVTATGLAAAAVNQARANAADLIAHPDSTVTSGAYTITRTADVPVVNGQRCPVGQTVAVTVVVTWRQADRHVRIDTDIAC